MSKKVIFLILSSFLLTGCFAETMTLVHSGVGASQGRAIQSTISPTLSFGVKQVTGKSPVEHIILREKRRIAKKASQLENKAILKTKNIVKKIEAAHEKAEPLKNSIKGQIAKINYNLIKAKSFAEQNFKHKPRFSYKAR